MTGALTRKLGPLPFWAWAVILFAGIWWYRNHISSSAASAATGSTTPVPGSPSGDFGGFPPGGGGSGGTTTPDSTALDPAALAAAVAGALAPEFGALTTAIAAIPQPTQPTATTGGSTTSTPGATPVAAQTPGGRAVEPSSAAQASTAFGVGKPSTPALSPNTGGAQTTLLSGVPGTGKVLGPPAPTAKQPAVAAKTETKAAAPAAGKTGTVATRNAVSANSPKTHT